jgi:ATP-dependent Zn protease
MDEIKEALAYHEAHKEETAYHEAGHAVIGRVVGMICGEVTIVPDLKEMSAGHSITGDVWDTDGAWMDRGKFRDHDSVLRGRTITMMAGAEAQEFFTGQECLGAGEDEYQILNLLDLLRVVESPTYADRLRRHTRHLVKRHAEKIR